MRVISINVNGIRSASSKGLFQWLSQQQADVVCLQEIRASLEHLNNTQFQLPGFEAHYFPAQRKGYSGVAIYSKIKPKAVEKCFKFARAIEEGRYLQLDFEALSIASLYLPSGSRDEQKQALKYEFMDKFANFLKRQRKKSQEFIICGDWNIAHKSIDLKNWRANQKNSGFLPEERAWLDQIFNNLGYIDAFRKIEKGAEQYTWWSNRGRAWENNVGWRLDYQVVTPGLLPRISHVEIYKQQKFSDHAPLIIDYNWP